MLNGGKTSRRSQDEGLDKIDITEDINMRVLRKMPSCNSTGPDNV